jgi:hypothetical protein
MVHPAHHRPSSYNRFLLHYIRPTGKLLVFPQPARVIWQGKEAYSRQMRPYFDGIGISVSAADALVAEIADGVADYAVRRKAIDVEIAVAGKGRQARVSVNAEGKSGSFTVILPRQSK